MIAFLTYLLIVFIAWLVRVYRYSHNFTFANDNEPKLLSFVNRFKFGFNEWKNGDKFGDMCALIIFSIVYCYVIVKFNL